MNDQTETVPLGEVPRPGSPGAAEGLDRGATVGRYVVLDRIGAGGMGVVYAAYDPELDRRVAIKLLRPDRFSSEAGRLRLLREAQALARLTHPNVVAVYDAGTFGDRVFVAMELVEGETLRQWLGEGPRSWREVLDRFLPAGRGLAAAHAAGLVHRDFKPENVLLGRDGRVRVADFGLAKALADAEEEPPGEAAEPGEGTPLTEWGVVLGTPAYMAPEQLRGIAADARSDQFSFCVALYEALYGERPFEEGGVVKEAPAGTKVPGWLRAVILRGLMASPEERYPTMDDLLRDLERDPATVRRRWLAAAAIVILAGAVFGSLGYFQARRAQLCGGAEEKVQRIWNEGRKQAIHAAFLATGAPFAEGLWKSVAHSLDLYLKDWGAMHRAACEATRLRGEQSEDLLDRRMVCLDQRLQEAGAVAGLFARADRQVLQKAPDTISGLTPVDTCGDVEALTAKVPPPRDPRLRKRVDAVRAELAEAQALTNAGKMAEALPKAQAAEAAARPLGYGPLEAEALFQKGKLQDANGDPKGGEETLFAALVAAQAAGHQEVAARAAAQLAWVTGYEQERAADGHRWFRQAEGIAEGAKGGDALRAELLQQLGNVLANERRFPEALEVTLRAEALAEKSLGPQHPRVASLLVNAGQYESQMGRDEEALRHAVRGLQIQQKALEPDHPDIAKTYNTLGNIYANLQRNQEAITAFESAVDIARRQYGPNHWLVGGYLIGLATAHQNLRHLDEALGYDRQAMAIFEGAFGPEPPFGPLVLNNMGEVLRLLGRHDEALAAYRRALSIQEKLLGPNHPDLGHSLLGVAEAYLDLGRAREAIAPAERALALREAVGVKIHPVTIAQNRFYLARALWDGGGDRTRAIQLARQAREALAKAGYADDQREVEAWLKKRGLA